MTSFASNDIKGFGEFAGRQMRDSTHFAAELAHALGAGSLSAPPLRQYSTGKADNQVHCLRLRVGAPQSEQMQVGKRGG